MDSFKYEGEDNGKNRPENAAPSNSSTPKNSAGKPQNRSQKWALLKKIIWLLDWERPRSQIFFFSLIEANQPGNDWILLFFEEPRPRP